MPTFSPYPGMRLLIGNASFTFVPHPVLSEDFDEVFVVEGGEALVYQLSETATGDRFALKVMKQSQRGAHLVALTNALQPLARYPGLSLCQRICLTRTNNPQLISDFPDLEFALLMPWIEGMSWSGLMQHAAVSAQYHQHHALAVALATAQVFWELEAHHIVHGDIAGANILLAPDLRHIELIDLERLTTPHMPHLEIPILGTPGYQHQQPASTQQFFAAGDRFAGAIVLAEMLTWWDPIVRAETPVGAETLFQPFELQNIEIPRLATIRDTLWGLSPPALMLFDRAWLSPNLAACPSLEEWALCLIAANGS